MYVDVFRVSNSSATHDSSIYGEETMWYLVLQIAKSIVYPHQNGEFEFMWNNIVGDITLEKH